MYKRQNTHTTSSEVTSSYPQDPSLHAQLSTVGMRVRQLVALGYQLPTNFPQRVPLPNLMETPPALSPGLGLTLDSTLGLNLGDWGMLSIQMVPESELGRKRPLEPDHIKLERPPLGELRFDEEF